VDWITGDLPVGSVFQCQVLVAVVGRVLTAGDPLGHADVARMTEGADGVQRVRSFIHA